MTKFIVNQGTGDKKTDFDFLKRGGPDVWFSLVIEKIQKITDLQIPLWGQDKTDKNSLILVWDNIRYSMAC